MKKNIYMRGRREYKRFKAYRGKENDFQTLKQVNLK